MKLFTVSLTAATLLTGASLVQAEPFDAAAFHQKSCMSCHGTEVYTRPNRRIGSLPALEAQVARCDANLATQLFPQDLDHLVDYLNTSYYKFDG
jgi:hypothetical protein